MADNKQPPKEGTNPNPSSRRRIAPTNISARPQSSQLRTSTPYPFQQSTEADGDDAADDTEDKEPENSNKDTRLREDRELSRLANSFFERRPDNQGGTGWRWANAVNTPSPLQNSLISPDIRGDRYYNLAHVADADEFDPEYELHTELYEVQWSGEHIQELSQNELKLKFLQEYPGLMEGAVETIQVPVESSETQRRILVRIAPTEIRGIVGIVFPIMGSRVILTTQDGTRLLGALYRARADDSIVLRNPTLDSNIEGEKPGLIDYVDGDGNQFAIVQPQDIYDFKIEQLPEPGRTIVAHRRHGRNSQQASSEHTDGSTESEPLTIHSPRIRAIRTRFLRALRSQHSGLSQQEESEIDTEGHNETLMPEAGTDIGTESKSRLLLSGTAGRHASQQLPSPLDDTLPREGSPPGGQAELFPSSSQTGPPLQFENFTQASLATTYPYMNDSSSENFDSAASGIGNSPLCFDSSEGARDSGFEGSSPGYFRSTERHDPETPSTPSICSNVGPSRDGIRNTSTPEESLGGTGWRELAADGDLQHWIMFSNAWPNLEQETDGDPDHELLPRHFQTSAAQEGGHESDPDGLYNASPLRRRRVTLEEEITEAIQRAQQQTTFGQVETGLEQDGSDPYGLHDASSSQHCHATREQQEDETPAREQPHAPRTLKLVNPNKTEDDISSQSRLSDQERSSSSSGTRSTSRGRSRKKGKKSSKKNKKAKKRSRSRK